jgi:hypothetical protein
VHGQWSWAKHHCSGIFAAAKTNLYALETGCHWHGVDFSKEGT